jgi:hypothetical protein
MNQPIQVFSNEQLKQEMDDVERLTDERLDEVVAAFVEDLEAGGARLAHGRRTRCPRLP